MLDQNQSQTNQKMEPTSMEKILRDQANVNVLRPAKELMKPAPQSDQRASLKSLEALG